MRKAYDQIEWDFLEASVMKMGFDERWVNWIMQCVTTSLNVKFNGELSVKFNGEPVTFFPPTRGIRQGDPLSPYLFIPVANFLSILMSKAIEDESIKGIRLNRSCPTLPPLTIC